jgi:hypothetical protein
MSPTRSPTVHRFDRLDALYVGYVAGGAMSAVGQRNASAIQYVFSAIRYVTSSGIHCTS